MVGPDSSVGIATRYGLDGRRDLILLEARFFRTRPDRPWAHPASYTVGTGSAPTVKRPGRGVAHPTQYSAYVKERVQLHLYSPSMPSWQVKGWLLIYTE
jgi:hypothetical protein